MILAAVTLYELITEAMARFRSRGARGRHRLAR